MGDSGQSGGIVIVPRWLPEVNVHHNDDAVMHDYPILRATTWGPITAR